ncbi:hypothetical protein [Enterobacter sp. A103]|uniref:hypothetical protein n=1 Tax=Enterobacter sp. A103 TaxID=3102785 RepID=UPI002ACA00F4|nr:hypothetical protein [Enterobacter sp. A103]MDZ5641689.1 hypothetical protein [Enterobacter sp. A103]
MKKENKIGFLKRGCVSLCSTENDIVTVSIEGPAILGMAQMFHDTQSHYIRCNRDCEIVVIDTFNFIQLLTQKKLVVPCVYDNQPSYENVLSA